ncbi:sulfatase [Arenibacter sp. S6351L]|uniref:sulfatase family protein n=1 Tax=Arenibacter sp. S6351L TaxID=2926407 RepID=UPI001FF64A71|nr:sulfatase [Arenibacter sp. S6351L]MCK0137022.1 sulfatase [Arenibacter sp. S6351L]
MKNKITLHYFRMIVFYFIGFHFSWAQISSFQTYSDRPNMLFILTDDQSQRDMGAYGNKVLSTPNMDKLASEGMVFDNAFTSTAMCVPSRATLLTGLYPMRHGAEANHAPIKKGINSVSKYLGDLGYRVGLIGKTHINPIDSFDFDYVKRLQDFAWDSTLTKNEMLSAMKILNKGGAPFVLFVCISNPHTPWPSEWSKTPEEVELPPYLVDEPQTRLTMSRYYSHVEIADKKVGEAISAAQELNLYDDMLVFMSSDHGAEFVHSKYTLYDEGIKVPFIARWPGHIKSNSRTSAMIEFVDIVPTMINIAGGKPVKKLDGQSMLPVLLGKAANHKTYAFSSSSKDGNKTDYPIKSIRSKEYKYITNPEYHETYTSWITDSTLGDNWPGYDRHYGYWLSWIAAADTSTRAKKMVDNYLHRPSEELYDLTEDPYELNNIANNPEYKKVKLNLRERLRKWMIEQRDIHFSAEFFNELPK